MAHKYKIDQRVNTPKGSGIIDTMPYNNETKVYGVWLDKPEIIETSKGSVLNRWVPVHEDQISLVKVG